MLGGGDVRGSMSRKGAEFHINGSTLCYKMRLYNCNWKTEIPIFYNTMQLQTITYVFPLNGTRTFMKAMDRWEGLRGQMILRAMPAVACYW
jgi:hypothetical protein